jgi:hypothetical protein
LRMPCLRYLQVGEVNLQQDHSNAPCSLQYLHVGDIYLQYLSRLPLHSLTCAFELDVLCMYLRHPSDLQAVVDNMARCKPGFSPPSRCLCVEGDTDANGLPADADGQQLAALRAVKALLNQFCGSLEIFTGIAINAAFLLACAECGMLLDKVTTLTIDSRAVTPGFWQQAQLLMPGVCWISLGFGVLSADAVHAMAAYLASLAGPVTVSASSRDALYVQLQQACMGFKHVTMLDSNRR